MKVSLSWLQEYVDIEMPVNELAEALTMAGLEVDSVSDRYAYLDSVVAGRVLEVSPFPGSDALTVCRVDVGRDQIDVICGAPNVRVDMVTACALPGTEMPDGTVLDVRTVHGRTSRGMLCSAGELALGDDFAGVMVLENDVATGTPIASALGLSDAVIEIDLTPNRPDCLSVIGIGREVAAIQQTVLRDTEGADHCGGDEAAALTSVDIKAPELCPRYAARLVFDITVAPSPMWLQERLLSVGLRPINNIVDITNFVMMETGQPLHAFDFDLLDGQRIVVREAQDGETFVTLDQKERRLDVGMLLICDAKKPVAVAGVMGGMNSEIQDRTTRVLIESAYFNPGSIRKTAKKLGLNTDASHRFERGVDPRGTVRAISRAAELMARIAGGELVAGVVDVHPLPSVPVTVELDVDRTNRLLGLALTREQMSARLSSIAFGVEPLADNRLKVTAPSFRVDINRPEDLMEEVARLSGYNTIPTTLPAMIVGDQQPKTALTVRNTIKEIMTGFGFSEAVNYSFVAENVCEILRMPADDPRRSVVRILNPLTEDQAVMRTTLVSGLLATASRNNARQMKTVKLFETGKVFIGRQPNEQPHEIEFAAGVWTGFRQDNEWYGKAAPCDFYDVKGVLEGLLAALRFNEVSFQALPDRDCLYTRPGVSATVAVAGEVVGLVGEVHPAVLEGFGMKQTAFVFELNLDQLETHLPGPVTSAPLPRFPSTARDLTMIVDKSIPVQQIMTRVKADEENLVEDILLFDVYEGKPIADGKKSVSIRVIYRSPDRTLEDDFVNHLHHRISSELITSFDAMLP